MANKAFEELIRDATNATPPYLVDDYIPVIRGGVTRHILGNSLSSTSGKNTISSKISDYTVLVTDSGTHFNNSFATGTVNFTLPNAESGLNYLFTVYSAQLINVICIGGDVIKGGTVFSANRISSLLPYSVLVLEAHDVDTWIITSVVGTWDTTNVSINSITKDLSFSKFIPDRIVASLREPGNNNLIISVFIPERVTSSVFIPGNKNLAFTTSIPDRTP